MNAYDYITTFATAVRDDATVKAYAIATYGKGLLVQIDTDMEDLIGSDEAPYLLIKSIPGADDSPVVEMNQATILLEAGAVVSGNAPYYSDTTKRTTTANGLRVYGQGSAVCTLLEKCIDAIKAKALTAGDQLQTTSIDAEGSLFFPLQVARSNLTVVQTNDMSSF